MSEGSRHYSLETLAVLLERVEKNMVTKGEIESLQKILTINQAATDKRLTEVEVKLNSEVSKLNARIDNIAKDDVDLQRIKLTSRNTLIGAIAVAVLSLVGSIFSSLFGGS